jgi:hypothetical protein
VGKGKLLIVGRVSNGNQSFRVPLEEDKSGSYLAQLISIATVTEARLVLRPTDGPDEEIARLSVDDLARLNRGIETNF